MRIISHRGNLNGPEPTFENTFLMIDFIREIYPNFWIECDLWRQKYDGWYLGHDEDRLTKIQDLSAFLDKGNLLIHVKSDAYSYFAMKETIWTKQVNRNIDAFAHDKDPYVTTVFNQIIIHPDHVKGMGGGFLAMLPEKTIDLDDEKTARYELSGYQAICTDYPLKVAKIFQGVI